MYDVLAYFMGSATCLFALARLFAAPYRAVAALQRARTNYFEARLTAAQAKDDWRLYKIEQSVSVPLRPGNTASDERSPRSSNGGRDRRGSSGN